jgi:hypothetical protein
VDWLDDACIALIVESGWHSFGRYPPALAETLHNPPANGKQGQIPKEMSQTLLTYKKQGNLD